MFMKLIYAILIVLLSFNVCAYNLDQYPDMFVSSNRLKVTVVVGDNALASDTVGAIEIVSSFYEMNYSSVDITSVLASEVEDISDGNYLLVGGPCANDLSAKLMDFPPVCSDSIPPNSGILKLFDLKKGTTLMVAGSSALDTRRVSLVLSNFEKHDFPAEKTLEVFNYVENKLTID